MMRGVLKIVSVLAFVLCMATALLWARSYWVADSFNIDTASYPRIVTKKTDEPEFKDRILNTFLSANRGMIEIAVERSTEEGYLRIENLKDWNQTHPAGTFVRWNRGPSLLAGDHFPSINVDATEVELDHLGFFIGQYSVPGMMGGSVDFIVHIVDIPLWSLFMLLAALPAVRLLVRTNRLRRCRREANGLCPICGYDLRASKERCPECGTPISMKIEAQI
jgi:hypothetical protein